MKSSKILPIDKGQSFSLAAWAPLGAVKMRPTLGTPRVRIDSVSRERVANDGRVPIVERN